MSRYSKLEIKAKPPDLENKTDAKPTITTINGELPLIPNLEIVGRTEKLVFDISQKVDKHSDNKKFIQIVAGSTFDKEINFDGKTIKNAYYEYTAQIPANAVKCVNARKVVLYTPIPEVISAVVTKQIDEKFGALTKQITRDRTSFSAEEYVQLLKISRQTHDDCDFLLSIKSIDKSDSALVKLEAEFNSLIEQRETATARLVNHLKQMKNICTSVYACVGHYDDVLTVVEQ